MSVQSLVSSSKDEDVVFRALASKYAVDVPESWILRNEPDVSTEKTCLCPGTKLASQFANAIPLFPWRCERRFVELAKLVATKTVENVVMCRFSCTGKKNASLKEILYREFDLLEWFNASPIKSLYASIADNRFANVLVRLENGCVCSVEVGATLPEENDASLLDRHELIGQRGVASDRVVDTQLPQSSVYLFQGNKTQHYTDVDAELFGMDNDGINLVRAAWAFVSDTTSDCESRIAELVARHQHLSAWVDLVFLSNESGKHVCLEGVC